MHTYEFWNALTHWCTSSAITVLAPVTPEHSGVGSERQVECEVRRGKREDANSLLEPFIRRVWAGSSLLGAAAPKTAHSEPNTKENLTPGMHIKGGSYCVRCPAAPCLVCSSVRLSDSSVWCSVVYFFGSNRINLPDRPKPPTILGLLWAFIKNDCR